MPARLSQSADFERALRQPAWARSMHFAMHFAPEPAPRARGGTPSTDLSTVDEQGSAQLVDDSPSPARLGWAEAVRLGAVVPKRHARRAVTRSLIKREIRAVAARTGAWLVSGIWVVRLRAPFDRAQFVSAASGALRQAARGELEALFESACQRLRAGPPAAP